jgi:tetratricopeptide (TPR) repeat protein
MKNRSKLMMLVVLMGAAVQSRAAIVSLSLNGESSAEVEAGTPVIIAATVTDKATVTEPEWKLAVLDASAQRVDVDVQLRSKEAPQTFGKFSTCSAVWTLAANVTASLAAGQYQIRMGEGKPAFLQIVNASVTEDADRKIAKLLLLSEVAALDGKRDEAMAHADAILALNPDSVAGRLRKSELVAEAGELGAALRLLDEAEQLARTRYRNAHAPVLIQERQKEILERMAKNAN